MKHVSSDTTSLEFFPDFPKSGPPKYGLECAYFSGRDAVGDEQLLIESTGEYNPVEFCGLSGYIYSPFEDPFKKAREMAAARAGKKKASDAGPPGHKKLKSSATGAAGAASALALLAHPKKGEKQYKFLLSHEPILLQGDLHGAGKTVKIRVPLVAGLTERQVVAAAGSTFTYPCADGIGSRPYRKEDLKWDLDKGFLTYHGAKHVEKKRKLSATQAEKDSFFNDKVFKPENQTNAKCHPFDSHLDDW